MHKLFLFIFLLLGGCGTSSNKPEDSLFVEGDQAIKVGFMMIEKQDWERASRAINLALQSNTSLPSLHVLNGSVYEQMAVSDPGALSLALVAYKNAIGIDPNNYNALMGYGRVLLKKRDFQKSREIFARVLISKPKDANASFGLACSSYGIRDLQIARGSILKALALDEDNVSYLRMGVIIFAALGDFPKANFYLDKVKALNHSDFDVSYLEKRIQDWKVLHDDLKISPVKKLEKREEKLSKKNYFNPRIKFLADDQSDEGADEGSNQGGDDSQDDENEEKDHEEKKKMILQEFSDPKSFMVDCVILRISEGRNTSFGNNMLESFSHIDAAGNFHNWGGMAITPSSYSPANFVRQRFKTYSYTETGRKILDPTGDPDEPATTIATDGSQSGLIKGRGLQVGFDTLRYNLNLFNATDENVQVSAKQTLLVEIGKEANFSSGDTLVSVNGTDLNGALSSVPSGSKMTVTVNNVKGEVADVSIDGSCTWLIGEQNTNKSLADQTVKTYKTEVSTNLKVNLGETIVLAGLQQDAKEYKRSRVPGVGSLPFFDVFLSNRRVEKTKLSAMIMVTVRPSQEAAEILKKMLRVNPRNYSQTPSLKALKDKESDVFSLPPVLVSVCKALGRNLRGWLDSDVNSNDSYKKIMPSKEYFKEAKSELVSA